MVTGFPTDSVNIFENGGAGPLIRKDRLPPDEGGAFVGEFKMFLQRADALKFGWYAMNGDYYSLSSPQGEVLYAFPTQFKSDWGITVSADAICLPKAFDSGGNGYFPRAVDGSSRQVGSKQGDAIREIAGDPGTFSMRVTDWTPTGVYAETLIHDGYAMSWTAQSNAKLVRSSFAASRAVPTAAENRPINFGVTYAMYLGV